MFIFRIFTLAEPLLPQIIKKHFATTVEPPLAAILSAFMAVALKSFLLGK